jgi:hypothetical protein
MDSNAWWLSRFRVFQTNLREIDAGLDVGQILDHIENIGAGVWLLNTAGIVSFYPSQLPFQHPSPWLADRASGDLVGDAIEQAHARGIRVISRVDISKVHSDVAEAHPDWCFVGSHGESQIYNGLYTTCPSGPYYQERVLDILGEVLDRYEPDGFFFNMFKFKQTDYSGVHHGLCHCDNCAQRFRAMYGLDLPVSEDLADKTYLAWRQYAAATINECSSRVREFVKRERPGCAVLLRGISDVTFREANNAIDRPAPIWVHWAAEQVQDVVGTRPEAPLVVNSVMFVDIPYRFMAEQSGLLGLHLVQTIAHGGNPMAYVLGVPELLKPAAFDVVKEVFEFHRENEKFYDGARPAARVALLSSQTRDESFGEAKYAARTQKERRGIHRALIESHVPFDLIGEDHLETATSAELRARFDCIIAPDIQALTDLQCAVLDGYVALGGGLVSTFDTASRHPDGSQREEVGLASLGADRILSSLENDDVRSAYVRPREDQTDFEFGYNRLITVDRNFTLVGVKAGAEVPLTFVPPSRYGPPEKCYWDNEPGYPGLITFAHGEGKSVCVPWPIGTLFHDLSIPEYREILEQAIEYVSASPRQVVTNAPTQVEVVVSQQPETGSTLIHLINYSGHDGRAFHEPLEIRDIQISLDGIGSITTARSQRLDTALDLTLAGDHGITVTLPRLGLFDLIVLN